ncbi:MAG: FMN-binding protein [Lysobacterales bacterium]
MHQQPSVIWLAAFGAAISIPAGATTYFSVAEVSEQLFPAQLLTPVPMVLTPADVKAVQKASGVRVRESRLKLWRAADGGWMYIDRVLGKHEYITYALALDANGAVTGLEILEYRETYGDQVRHPKWRAQFTGKQHGATLKLQADIANLSGATLSSLHLTEGVRRLLATHQLVVAARG